MIFINTIDRKYKTRWKFWTASSALTGEADPVFVVRFHKALTSSMMEYGAEKDENMQQMAIRGAENNSTTKDTHWTNNYLFQHYDINVWPVVERNWTTMLALPWTRTYLLTYLRSWALLEKPPIVQPLKNFPAFYETRRFNAVFTRALHWSLSWAMPIQSAPSHPISQRSILILFTHLRLGLPSGLFPSG
jgi:hypothetical protein